MEANLEFRENSVTHCFYRAGDAFPDQFVRLSVDVNYMSQMGVLLKSE